MVFSSVEFLFFFFPVALGAYIVAPNRSKNLVLLLTSVVFYTWGGGAFVALLLVSTVVDYCAALLVSSGNRSRRLRLRRLGIALSVTANLGLLIYYKYSGFFVEQLNRLGESMGFGPIAWTSVALPIGISFFTFQSMSYTLDVARGRCEPLRNPLDFALYVALFPQLIAGPIVRFHEISEQIRKRSPDLEDFSAGMLRFAHGLAKKVLIADTVAPVADAAFGASDGELSALGALIGMLAYTLQIYFDFSGYSDMAIGLGRMFGFNFPENFRRPYSALSVTDFWRRWHMTLSNWIRDYLYIPLGGNRGSRARTVFNLITVFVLVGFWHGAAWTFLFWGLGHGVVLLWERARGTTFVDEAPRPAAARARTLLLVMLLWVLFRAESAGLAAQFFKALVGASDGFVAPDAALQAVDLKQVIAMVIGTATFFLPGSFVASSLHELPGRVGNTARTVLLAGAQPLTLIFVVSGTFSPFLYFQF